MAVSLYEGKKADDDMPERLPKTSITPGIVMNNVDCLIQGKVLVRLPEMDQEIWARMTAPGAGKGTGMFHAPNKDDEVLVALVHSDPADAYLLGGLWSTTESPPIAPLPTNVPTKRIIRSGVTSTVGHEIEFDDALQTLTITSAFPAGGLQKIKLAPQSMTLTNPYGSVTIGVDPANPMFSVAVDSKGPLKISSQQLIQLSAPKIAIEADLLCTISGQTVAIN